ncbi:MAG: hypothetical protein IJ033_05515 [Clostridia bacterium]|nr:hypothetical protein [Clostridia bacterium]
MFDNTKAAWLKLKRFLNAITWVFNYGMNALMIVYLSLALEFEIGNFIANAILLPATIAIFIITIILGKVEKKPTRRKLRATKKVLRWSKLAVNAFSLGVTLYGMFIAASMVSPISIILTTLLIIMWIIKVLIELLTEVFEHFMKIFTESIAKDILDIKQNNQWLFEPKTFATEKVELVKEKAGETIEVVKSSATSFAEKIKAIFKKNSSEVVEVEEVEEDISDEETIA